MQQKNNQYNKYWLFPEFVSGVWNLGFKATLKVVFDVVIAQDHYINHIEIIYF